MSWIEGRLAQFCVECKAIHSDPAGTCPSCGCRQSLGVLAVMDREPPALPVEAHGLRLISPVRSVFLVCTTCEQLTEFPRDNAPPAGSFICGVCAIGKGAALARP